MSGWEHTVLLCSVGKGVGIGGVHFCPSKYMEGILFRGFNRTHTLQYFIVYDSFTFLCLKYNKYPSLALGRKGLAAGLLGWSRGLGKERRKVTCQVPLETC